MSYVELKIMKRKSKDSCEGYYLINGRTENDCWKKWAKVIHTTVKKAKKAFFKI